MYKPDEHAVRAFKLRNKYKEISYEILGGALCRNCKIKDIRVLTINHKDGRTEETANERGYNLYRAIAKGKRKTDDLEILCANCQIIHEYERGNRKATFINISET